MLREQLKSPAPAKGSWHYENFALAAYYLNERVAEADQAMLTEHDKVFPAAVKGLHWHAALPERIYFLFGSRSKFFPGRMSKTAEDAVLDMLWQWAAPRCRLEMTLAERDWWQWGSENHHSLAWTGFWGAAQIFVDHPDYKDRRYADGSTPAEMSAAFNEYFKRYARERASKGLLIEVNSFYNKYTTTGWYNLADFASDPVLRRRMQMLLELYWADWAVEQINGVRGGSRHRSYPGPNSTQGAVMDGIAWYHFGLGTARNKLQMAPATTFWRPSPVVMDLALDVAGRGEFEYLSRRPGLVEPQKPGEQVRNFVSDPKLPYYLARGVQANRPEGGGLVRYTYGTPDFIIGTSMVEARPYQDWNGASSQNHWDGVIFAGHRTARIFVQPLKPKAGSFYNANGSVEKGGAMIVQRLKTAVAKGQRVWFDASLRRIERDGWVFAEAPQAFAAVRVVTGGTAWEPDTLEQHVGGAGRTDVGLWLKCQDEFSPVILEVARKSAAKDFAAFQSGILANSLKWENARLDYSSARYQTTLTLFADYSQPPQVNGEPLNYAPKKVYDSPFIESDFGSGVVTIQKDARKLVLDFNSTDASPMK